MTAASVWEQLHLEDQAPFNNSPGNITLDRAIDPTVPGALTPLVVEADQSSTILQQSSSQSQQEVQHLSQMWLVSGSQQDVYHSSGSGSRFSQIIVKLIITLDAKRGSLLLRPTIVRHIPMLFLMYVYTTPVSL